MNKEELRNMFLKFNFQELEVIGTFFVGKEEKFKEAESVFEEVYEKVFLETNFDNFDDKKDYLSSVLKKLNNKELRFIREVVIEPMDIEIEPELPENWHYTEDFFDMELDDKLLERIDREIVKRKLL